MDTTYALVGCITNANCITAFRDYETELESDENLHVLCKCTVAKI